MAETITTGRFLIDVHSGLKNRVSVNGDKKAIAQELENFFNSLNNASDSEFFDDSNVKQAFYQRLQSLNNVYNNNLGLFKYKGSSANKAGASTEKDIQNIFSSIFSIVAPQLAEAIIQEILFLQGEIAKINNNPSLSKSKKDSLRAKINADIYKLTGNLGATSGGVQVNSMNQLEKIKSTNYLARQIKTDFTAQGLINFLKTYNFKSGIQIGEIDYVLSGKMQKIFSYFEKYRFSIKSSRDFAASKIGTTDPEKMFVAISSACTNYSEEQIIAQYHRMLNSYFPPDTEKTTSNSIIIKHTTHMRAAYELIGIGLLDVYGNQENIDFLIVSDTQGLVKVYDANSIIMDYLNGNNNDLFHFSSQILLNPLKAVGKTKINIKKLDQNNI